MASLEIINQASLGELNALELGIRLMRAVDNKQVEDALELATVLHHRHTRKNRDRFPDTPYIEHPLRNTLRIYAWGIKEQDILIASLLHDVVEDSSLIFVEEYMSKKLDESIPENEDIAREMLSRHISKSYGKRVLRIVKGVTNPTHSETGARLDSLSKKDKNDAYRKHVEEAIKDTDVFLVKLSDFIDNAAGLHHSMDPSFVKRQAPKYYPMIDVFKKQFLQHIERGSIVIDESQIEQITLTLEYSKVLLESVLNK